MARHTDSPPGLQVHRGEVLHFLSDPGADAPAGSFEYFPDGVLIIRDGRMHRAEDERRGGAIAHQLVEEDLRDCAGVREIGKARFFGKRVVAQPVQQVAPTRGNDIDLRVVNMSVDEARHQNAVRVRRDRRVCRQLRE